MVGGADVSLRPTPGPASGIGKGAEEIRGGQRRFGHAPVGAATSTKALNVGIHSLDGGVADRSDCWWMEISRQESVGVWRRAATTTLAATSRLPVTNLISLLLLDYRID